MDSTSTKEQSSILCQEKFFEVISTCVPHAHYRLLWYTEY